MEKVRCTAHIASLQERESGLYHAIVSLASQVDEIYIALNGYNRVPPWLPAMNNVNYVIADNRLADAHKFMFLKKVSGVALCCDDDLIYHKPYVKLMLDGLARNGGVVSLHGKIYPRPVTHFKRFSRSLHCRNENFHDVRVDVVGSGVCAFNVAEVPFDISFCSLPNMGDIWLSKFCHERGIPLTVIAHPKEILGYTPPPKGRTIWEMTKDYSMHTNILKEFLK